ncbi:hypothetical protein GCM10022420_041260 [Streptomyces iranensis]
MTVQYRPRTARDPVPGPAGWGAVMLRRGPGWRLGPDGEGCGRPYGRLVTRVGVWDGWSAS